MYVSGNATQYLCLPPCDPLGDDCLDNQKCAVVGESFGCRDGFGAKIVGARCHGSECGSGLVCADAAATPGCEGSRCCTPLCHLDAPACPDGQHCVPWFDPDAVPPGYDNLGHCSAT